MLITKYRLTILFTLSLLVLNLLIGFSGNFAGLQNILGFPVIVLLPGSLLYLLLRIRLKDFWQAFIFQIALGVFLLMLLGLFINSTLPQFGITRPLGEWPLLLSFDLAAASLIGLFAWTGKFAKLVIRLPKADFWGTALALTGPFLIFLSIIGAIQLNNGYDSYPTLVMLITCIGFLAILIPASRRIPQSLLLWCLYCVALALLLMTSLRGWYTTGHDIQREYHVFELTKVNGSWAIDRFRDAYNACISITILPTIFANLLKITDPFIYKTLFQIIFALVPVTVYLIARRFVDPAISVLTFIYFVSFPTFFGDMPFLNRQEIAFLFLSLMILLVFESKIASGKKKFIFLLFAVGLILSHYSTTYITVGILSLAWSIRFVLTRFHFKGRLRKLFQRSALLELNPIRRRHLITLPIVTIFAFGSFFWSSVLTDTGHGLSSTLSESFQSIRQGFSEDSKSADVLYSLFSFQSADLQKQLTAYFTKATGDALHVSHPDDFYPASSYAAYPIKVVSDRLNPLTNLGTEISKFVSVEKINFLFRQFQARILQLLIVIGIGFLLFRSSFTKKISPEYLALSIASGIIVMAVVVLPFLSVEYGLLRAFQQSLMVLGIFIVIGSLAIFPGRYVYKLIFASLLALFMMLSSTGVIPQLTGGYYPQLHLDNAGSYYDLFYTHKSEILGMDWLTSQIESTPGLDIQSEVQTDRFAIGRVGTEEETNLLNDIYPSLIRKNSFVYLGYSNSVNHTATVSYAGNSITYSYPIKFLDQNKDLLYNDGGSRVYK